MRLLLLISCLFFYCNHAAAFVCEGAFKIQPEKTYPSMSTWNWSYSSHNTSVFGDQKKYRARFSIGAAEDKACLVSDECIVSDVVCAVKTSLKSMLSETEEVDKPVRLRVISYSVYFALFERTIGGMSLDQSCKQAYENYYMALNNFWTEALRNIGYRVTDVYPFEVKFALKPEYLRDDECFHREDEVKKRISSLKIPGDPYGLAWARIGFGVSWYGADFFPAFDIEKIKALREN